MAIPILRRRPQSRKPEPPTAAPARPVDESANSAPEIPLTSLTIRTATGGTTFTGTEVARLLELAEHSSGHDGHDRIDGLTDLEDSLTLIAGVADIVEALGRRHEDLEVFTWETSRALEYLLQHARARLYTGIPWAGAREAAVAQAVAMQYLVTVPPAEPAASQEGR